MLSTKPDAGQMGIKGANLMGMAQDGLPVPPGFILSTHLGREVCYGSGELSKTQFSEIKQTVGLIEKELGRSFGGEDKPLLVSIRSGASVSMPGMMDTVLNLGLNNKVVAALAAETGDERFAWDTYRRFVQSFAQVVLGMDVDEFEDILEDMRVKNNVDADAQLSASSLKEITDIFQDIVFQETGQAFPQDVYQQMDLALIAVFNSWNTPRAKRYREINKISHTGGTAAIVQAMVFGNRNEKSCTGVYFTRNPSTGENIAYGEYMLNAQGEDVVSGIRTPMELTEHDRARAMSDNPSMEKVLPQAFEELMKAGGILETTYSDMQEIEFTVENERLFLLQTRNGKRTPKASLRIAVEMAQEETITKKQAIERCDMNALSAMLVSKVVEGDNPPIVTIGLPASPGAVSGKIVFSSDDAVASQEAGIDCILVRPETDPKDIHGMYAAVGILTTRGGMTSHAAVVARGMGKPCITAAMSLKIALENQSCNCMGKELHAGDTVTIDGASGLVFEGVQEIVVPEPDGELAILMGWKEALGG